MAEKNHSVLSSDKDDKILQWVTFCLGHETYGINVMDVQEVLRYTEIAPVPGSPVYVIGIINLRGNVVTVMDSRLRFGLSSIDVGENTRIVIVEYEQNVVGMLVDSVAEVVYLRESEIDPGPNIGDEGSARFVRGVCNKDDVLLILLDLGKLLAEENWDDYANTMGDDN
jgi:purine-binding chemotaxis protein CheW